MRRCYLSWLTFALTCGAIIKQFLIQSFMQSATAKAGAGEDSTAAPTVTALMMEAKESRRDWYIESSWWLTVGGVVGSMFFTVSEDFAVDPVWKNENPSADNNSIAPTSIREVNFVIVKKCESTSWTESCVNVRRELRSSNGLRTKYFRIESNEDGEEKRCMNEWIWIIDDVM